MRFFRRKERTGEAAPAEAAAPEDALRGALASLHRLLPRALPSLEGDVVRFANGGATCHLDTRQVISDVHRFLRLCRAAPHMPPDQARLAWQRARALYVGSLLDGPGARAWPWAAAVDTESEGLSLRVAWSPDGKSGRNRCRSQCRAPGPTA